MNTVLNRNRIITVFATLLFLGGLYVLNHLVTQHETTAIMVAYAACFGASMVLTFALPSSNEYKLGLMVVALTICITGFPALSDDVYRFVWDGHLIHEGISPYRFTPATWLNNHETSPYTELFPKLNSPHYFSVYPLVCQFIFGLSTWFSKSIQDAALTMKLVYCVFHLNGLYFARLWSKSSGFEFTKFWGYYLNPLVLVEGIGNLHGEVIMVGLLIPAFYYLSLHKTVKAAIFMALAIATKLLPLMLLPWVFFTMKGKSKGIYFSTLGVSLILLFIPVLWPANLMGFSDSLDLYFRKFEFNASIYYVLRWMGTLLTGHNLIQFIGPGLGLMATTAILYVSWQSRYHHGNAVNMSVAFMTILIIYILAGTTIHPWYLMLPLFWSVLTPYRYMWIWSYLITWTYISYQPEGFKENLWLVFFEYVVVLVIGVWELKYWSSKRLN
ncbi:MAG: hypothetical protein IPN29_16515 [Saprospiraceae bacterium]|nr:hypothetical protein [Saprospiraceae bacterium]